MESGGWRVEGGGWRVEGGGWRVEGGGWNRGRAAAHSARPIMDREESNLRKHEADKVYELRGRTGLKTEPAGGGVSCEVRVRVGLG